MLCDIGCDHGYLALQLLVQRKAKSVVAADMRELPLKSAQDTFPKIMSLKEFHLC